MVCLTRVGAETHKIVSTSLEPGRGVKMVIPGETDALKMWSLDS